MYITCIIGDYTYSKPLSEVYAQLRKRFKSRIDMVTHCCLRHQAFTDEQLLDMERDVSRSDIIFLWMVFDDEVISILEKYAQQGKTYLILASTGKGMRLTSIGKFHMHDIMESFEDSMIAKVFGILKGLTGKQSPMEVRKMLSMADSILKVLKFGRWKDAYNYVQVWKYFFNGGKQNILNMFLMLFAEYYGFKTAYEPPFQNPDICIIHPRAPRIFTGITEYLSWYRQPVRMLPGSKKKIRPRVGILFYNQRFQSGDTHDLDAVIEQLEARGIGVVPAVTNGIRNMKTIRELFFDGGSARVDAVISFLYFRLDGGPLGGDYEAFERLCTDMNVPIIKYHCLSYSTLEQWQARSEGLAPMETSVTVVFPEMDGVIEGQLVSGSTVESSKGRNTVRVMEPISERVAHAAERTARWIDLKYRPNSEKKIAVILYNYPPGKSSLGAAGNLDTLESLVTLLTRLQKEGYNVQGFPRTRHEFVRLLTQRGIANQDRLTPFEHIRRHALRVPCGTYRTWFSRLPDTVRQEVEHTWGKPPGSVMADSDALYIPGLTFGNVFVGFQPPRGMSGSDDSAYHDTALVPHHQYIAFYRYIEQTFKADALLHLGTHGTLEFLPGKQLGLSGSCYPDLLIGSLPHIYVYSCSNPSEAMLAKRRSYALCIGYMTPPMAAAELYGPLIELESDMHNYFLLKQTSPGRAQELKQKIIAEAQQHSLVHGGSGETSISALYDRLCDMKQSLTARGLHRLGSSLSGDELVDYLFGIMKFDRGDIASLQRCLAPKYDADWDSLNAEPSCMVKEGVTAGALCDTIHQEARELLQGVLIQKEPLKKAVKRAARRLPRDSVAALQASLAFASDTARLLSDNRELSAAVQALEGRYIPPGIGGSPVRTPAVLPTGRNLYQFNPDLIPTEQACERGSTAASHILSSFQKAHSGRYPETVAVVLWGYETMKSQGETIGEIFHLLGVRARRSDLGDVIGIDPVPLEQLGRPRIDVAVEISGLFRDTFPVALRLLDRAFKLVANLDEPEKNNYVKKHARSIQKALVKEGISPADAAHLSQSRIFGPSASGYGTDVTQLVENAQWEQVQEIADLHIERMSHVYGDMYQAMPSIATFKEVLDTVDVVTQIRDTDEYGIVDLDHYYEYLGGLSSSVERIRKTRSPSTDTRPFVMVTDSTREAVKTLNLAGALSHEMHTKVLNPVWIDAQLAGGYHGIKNMSDCMTHLVGWQATTDSVDSAFWSKIAETYLFDDRVRGAMMKENVWAVESQLRRAMEAYQRGMWDAREDEITRLKKIYLEIETELEEMQ